MPSRTHNPTRTSELEALLVPFRALADVLIEPALEACAILAFDQHAPIIDIDIDIGYGASRERIAAWQAAGGQDDGYGRAPAEVRRTASA